MNLDLGNYIFCVKASNNDVCGIPGGSQIKVYVYKNKSRPFDLLLFFVNRIGISSNQIREDLKLLYKIKPLLCKIDGKKSTGPRHPSAIQPVSIVPFGQPDRIP
jgi:hypothetical protein